MRRSPPAIWRATSATHQRLVLRLLAAVGVAGIDHQPRRNAGLTQLGAGRLDAGGIIVRRAAAAQDDVAVLVAGGRGDRRAAALGHRHEMVRLRGRLHRVDRDPHVAVGAVLEADRAGQPRSQLAMDLALGGARADRAPSDTRSAMYCGVVMSRNSAPAGRPRLFTRRQHVAREPQALVDAEAAVEIGVVDQPLPADRGARLLEIDAHHDFEPVGEALAQLARRSA